MSPEPREQVSVAYVSGRAQARPSPAAGLTRGVGQVRLSHDAGDLAGVGRVDVGASCAE